MGGAASSGAKRLEVPHAFTRFQFSVIYTQLGATQGTLMEQQRSMLQAILKSFTKDLISGLTLSIVGHSGRNTDCLCHMDSKMTIISMVPANAPPAAKGAKDSRVLVLSEIVQICSPEEVRNLRCSGTTPLFADERCTTLVLTGQRYVTFRLDSVAAREYLMLCLQVLRMSQEHTRMWYNSNNTQQDKQPLPEQPQ